MPVSKVKIPNSDRAEISERKLEDYLLSESHPDGSSKAKFFLKCGFQKSKLDVFQQSLRSHLLTNEVTSVNRTPFGVSYTVEGLLNTPSGRAVVIRSVWFVTEGERIPRLTTAYPIKGKRK